MHGAIVSPRIMRILFRTITITALSALILAATEAPKPPTLNTAKFWRLNSAAMTARQQLHDAETAVQQEVTAMTVACGANFILGYQSDQKADNVGDLICIPKPVEAKAAEPVEKK